LYTLACERTSTAVNFLGVDAACGDINETGVVALDPTGVVLDAGWATGLSHTVTAAAGFIGSGQCEHLVASGFRVAGLDNFDPFYSQEIKENNLALLSGNTAFTFYEGDIRDAALLDDTKVHIGQGLPEFVDWYKTVYRK
jgi:hypothetical protein